jgi:hypothetical protein
MIITISKDKLSDLLEKATEAGAKKVLAEMGLRKSQVSQREAYRLYGEGRIKKWRQTGKVFPAKIGGKIYYDRQKLEHLKSINDIFL